MSRLPPRKAQILELFAESIKGPDGRLYTRTHLQVAELLGLSERTITNHLSGPKGIYNRLDVRTGNPNYDVRDILLLRAVVVGILSGEVVVDGIKSETIEAWRSVLSETDSIMVL